MRRGRWMPVETDMRDPRQLMGAMLVCADENAQEAFRMEAVVRDPQGLAAYVQQELMRDPGSIWYHIETRNTVMSGEIRPNSERYLSDGSMERTYERYAKAFRAIASYLGDGRFEWVDKLEGMTGGFAYRNGRTFDLPIRPLNVQAERRLMAS